MEAVKVSGCTAALELLDRTFTSLPTTKGTDMPILFAIDTERSKDRLSEVGISTLDPYCLLLPGMNHDRISTYCYAKGGSRGRSRYEPYRFGTSLRFKNEEVQQILEKHINNHNDDHGSPRKVILVGHNIAADIRFLKQRVGLDICRMSNVEAIIDTQNIGLTILRTPLDPSLKHILKQFKLDYTGLHNAAHDARYTLRALLMLYVRHRELDTAKQSEQMTSVLRIMEDIARHHKPNWKTRVWSTRKRPMRINIPALFDQDIEDDSEFGMLSLLDQGAVC